MNTRRHPRNRNLHLHYGNQWNGFPVLTERGPLIEEYLHRISMVLDNALDDFPRTFIARVDLRLPSAGDYAVSGLISRFMASLNAQLAADENRRAREGLRIHPNVVRFVWAREQSSSRYPHYHLALFFNRDAYHTLGAYWAADGNLASRITRALGSALGIQHHEAKGLAHFVEEGAYSLNIRDQDFGVQKAMVFKRLSYLAKAATKYYGEGANHFGYSRH